MRRRNKWNLAGVTALGIGASLLVGQSGPAASATAKAQTVSVGVSVLDKQGEPVTGLTNVELAARAGDRAVPVLSVQAQSGEPQSVCVILDNSGSMYETTAAVQAEVKRLMSALPAGDEMCVVAFATKVALAADFSDPRSSVTTVPARLPRAWGGSATIDALLWTEQYMEERSRNRNRVIVLIGDGDDNASVKQDDALREALQQAGAPVVYAILNRETEMEKPLRVRWMTGETGGVACAIKKNVSPEAAVDNLVRVMQGRYRLTFSRSDVMTGPKSVRLKVVPAGQLSGRNVQIRVAQRYDAASQ